MQTNLLARRALFIISMAGLLALNEAGHAAESASKTYDVWIRNGTIVDGTGQARFTADILVSGDTIVYVGATAGRTIEARRTIDAAGNVVTPGYIDLHAHGEPTQQSFNNFLAQGVTTVVLGQDGGSAGYEGFPEPTLAQWRADRADRSSGNDGSFDAEKPIAMTTWMRRAEAHGSEVNMAALSGHGSLRLIAGVGNEPVPTPEQMAAMQEVLQADLAAGAFGMSFGLEYMPGRFASLAEEKALGDTVGRQGGIVMSHMRSEDFDKISTAIDELLQIDAHVHVSHLKIVAGQRAEEGRAVLDQLARARVGGRRVTGDVYPYLASASSLHFLYPDWARTEEQYNEAVKNRRAELEAHLRKRVEERNGAQAIMFTSGPLAGQRLSEVARRLGKPYEKVIIDDIGFYGPQQAHFLMAETVQSLFIGADQVGFCTDGSPTSGHPRGAGTFIKVLEDYVGAPPKMSMERAVYKMSGLAADIMGIDDRGVIAQGRRADIVVLSPGQLHSRATYIDTKLAPSGVDFILVNGQVALDNGKPVPARYGKLLKRHRD
ncbi:N-acyl-D-amino-acid deacylase family protein [Peristeroidobacter soli]|uniref:N-acyl-D-amino-acid deacylase family protein n=1 Tax=Peristeroidobacter soli TaxID=2497877 RepID=UPI00101B5F39|nr:amidohydrolase family protein [Peristeroidobacter soli]